MITKIVLAVFLANSGGTAADVIQFDKEMESMAACERAVEMVMETYSSRYDRIQASCFKYDLTGA